MNYSNDNKGALFKNDKQGNESRPDYKGTLNVNGQDFWISAWLKSSKAGNKYMSLSVQPKEAQAGTSRRSPGEMPERMSPSEIPRGGLPHEDSDVPF